MRERYQRIWDSLAAGRRAVLVTSLSPGSPGEKHLFFEDEPPAADESPLTALARKALAENALVSKPLPGGVRFAEPFVPEPRLVVLGGGHIAVPLVEFGAKCGFRVTVVDDRPAFANAARFPLAQEVICESFERVFPRLGLNRYSFVVIITRGHRHDAACLRATLGHPVGYVGMIGSRRRVGIVKQSLVDEGFSQEQLDSVCTPIGMPIGAVTPEEIAISILGEIILHRRTLKKAAWPELDREVLSALIEAREVPLAIVTIISAQGSVPRGVGAKMLVWPHGQTLGSIGGGCSESAIMQKAYEVIRTGVPHVEQVDLGGSAAEDEGMVCGGKMQVAIERYEG